MSSSSKKYGLILSDKSKSQPKFQALRNVFGNDSDSEDESKKKPVLLRPNDNIKRQAKIAQEKAVMEDPTVYQYDEIYDTMASKKEEKKIKNQEEKKPRYIENLLKTANKRKIESERRIERQIQKEREKEGDEFADKEVFVTSAYKKKLEELHLEEEKEKREEYLESIGDVTKQRDLGGFYRHLYEQKLGTDKNIENYEEQNVNESEKTSTDENDAVKDGNKSLDKPETSKKRNYRKRKCSVDLKRYLSEGEIEDSDDEINRVNLKDIKLAKKVKTNENIDADSDFSIDESSDDESNVKDVKQSCEQNPKTSETLDNKELVSKTDVKHNNTNNEKEVTFKDEVTQEEAVQPKPKIDIWKKRTVGDVFEQALKRYYERKAARGI